MLAGTRESDDPILSLRVNTYVWPTCTSDSAPLVAASKMVKLVFQTCTQHNYCNAKKENSRYKTPKSNFIHLGIQKRYFTSNYKLFLNTKPCCRELKRKMQLTLPGPNLWICWDKHNRSSPLDKFWLYSVSISDTICLITDVKSPCQNPNNKVRCSVGQAAGHTMSLRTCSPELVQRLYLLPSYEQP